MAVLLTGFAGYGGRSLNPAEEVAKALGGAEVAGETVASRLLPVDYRELRPRIEVAVAEVRPRAVLSLGLWPGEPVVRLERVAVNCADFEIADNKGLLTREAVREGGPAARLSTLPLRAVQQRLLDAGIRAGSRARPAPSCATRSCTTRSTPAPAASRRRPRASCTCPTCRSRSPG